MRNVPNSKSRSRSSLHTVHACARNVLVSRFCPGEGRRTSRSLACVANALRGRFSCEGAAAVLVNVHRTCVGVLLCVKATTVSRAPMSPFALNARVIIETVSLASGRETPRRGTKSRQLRCFRVPFNRCEQMLTREKNRAKVKARIVVLRFRAGRCWGAARTGKTAQSG